MHCIHPSDTDATAPGYRYVLFPLDHRWLTSSEYLLGNMKPLM